MDFLIRTVTIVAHFSEGAIVFLTWELAWRNYGFKVALGAFAVVLAISFVSQSMYLIFSDDLRREYITNYLPMRALFELPFVLLLAYGTGALTRRIFGAGRKYSLRLPPLSS